VYRFLLRMPDELRERLAASARSAGRSLNREIVHRLEESLEREAVAPVVATRGNMSNFRNRRAVAVLAILAAALAAVIAGLVAGGRSTDATKTQRLLAQKQLRFESQGADVGAGDESNEYLTQAQQFAEARTAPSGIVNPGAYSSALGQLNALPTVGGTWSDITQNVKYDADHPAYRDYYSNSSGGSGLVTGRITGLASDAAGDIWAAGADGGVWRRNAGATSWTPISDGLLSLSTGDLRYFDGKLWYATGEANTGGTSYVGAGVYVLANPTSSTAWSRVGGNELESTTIGKLRFGGGKVWAATLRGVWSHTLANTTDSWVLSYAPHPELLPASLKPYAQTTALANAIGTGNSSSLTNAPYKNIANDVAIDPTNGNHIIAALAWRSGDSYNGFYETTDGGNTWVKVNPTGAIPADDIGYVTFAYSADASKLYAINQSPTLLNKLTGNVNSYLDGVYVSNNGSITGPWSKIADSQKLANSGSALKQAVGGKGYGPGIQAWYNQFLQVDPSNPDHVYLGLEEIYETWNGGSNWNAIAPYWNFYFSCWNPNVLYPPNGPNGGNGCPLTAHTDQHSVAIGGTGSNAFVVVGNDGGVYERPLKGSVNGNGNATDWTSLNDGSIDALQYYAVGIGKINHTVHSTPEQTVDENTLPVEGTSATGGVLVSGGLQDNGGSLLRPGADTMVSNFGGDGGDVLVDPNDGCNIVQEYVVLSMSVTQTCASPDPKTRPNAFLDLRQTTTFKIAPPDINARFIAPFVANKTDITEWLAGGNSLWVQNKGFAIRSGKEWTKAYSFDSTGVRVATALAMSGNEAIAAWCGPCNNNGFARGVAIGTKSNGKWTFAPANLAGVPTRYIGGVAIGPDGAYYLAINGFSRRFTEGEGAGVGHVFRSTDGNTWTDISANFPDIPANSIQALSDGSLVVGTDLGVIYRQPGQADWSRLGTNLPLTVDMDVELGPDGKIYAATHGRGIWSIDKP
jgi:Arc-like DNA binding domain